MWFLFITLILKPSPVTPVVGEAGIDEVVDHLEMLIRDTAPRLSCLTPKEVLSEATIRSIGEQAAARAFSNKVDDC